MSAQLSPAAAPSPGAWLHRPLQLSDLDAVMAVEKRAYSHPWTRGNFTDSLFAGYPTELRLDDAGELLGYWVAMPGADELHLLNITVAPDWQGRGHGRSLLQRVVAVAQARRDAMLWLEVRESNLGARALYRGAGFEEVGLRRGYYPTRGGREHAVVMRLGGLARPTAAPESGGPDGLD